VTTAVSTLLASILCVSAGSKAWRVRRAGEALATYGVKGARAQLSIAWALIAVELGLAVSLLIEVPGAAELAAGLFLAFAALTSAALLAGRRGQPCACFGSASRLSWASPLRALALASAAGVVASGWLPVAPSGYDRWLTVGLAGSLAVVAMLAVALLALAREVGVLRLEVSSRGALEIEREGPSLGIPQGWAAAIVPAGGRAGGRALIKLAVFTSDGCPLCRSVAPAVSHVAADPLVAVGIFHELEDARVWTQAGVPGSPYAVALDLDGVALAKGTFNGLAQLESILATARARERTVPFAA
jgi:Methylamine utilisation protein MauE